MDLSQKLYLSTIAPDAAGLACENGLGLEIAEFCTAFNMDADFERWDERVKREIAGVSRLVFHAPYNELCPAAVDPLIVQVARKRYEQAYRLMSGYAIDAMVVHSGFLPRLYDGGWFIEKSAAFWSGFLAGKPQGFRLFLENTFECSPELLIEIVRAVADERFRLCLDIGHAAAAGAALPLSEWIRQTVPFLGHVHLHNNDGKRDTHSALGDGVTDIAALLPEIIKASPGASFAIETEHCESSVEWLKRNGFLKRRK